MNIEEQLADALDACFGVMMQFTEYLTPEGQVYFTVPYDATVIIEAIENAERMYYEAQKKYADSKK